MFETLDIQLNGENAITLFLQPLVMVEDVLHTFRIMPRVTTKKRLYFFGKLSKIIQKNTGCGWNAQGEIDITNREIDPQRLKVNLELCSDVFWDSILEDALGFGLDIEKSPALIIGLIIRRINEAISHDLYTLGYFGDRSSADAFLNQLDGIFALIGDLILAGTITPVNSNSGAALAAGASYQILDALVNDAPVELRQIAPGLKVIKVTSSIFQNYQQYLEALGVMQSYTAIVDGINRLTFRNILLEEHVEWDLNFNGPTNNNAGQPFHVALYTINQNLVFATDITDPSAELRAWEDDKQFEKFYVKGKFKGAFNFVHEKYLHIAM